MSDNRSDLPGVNASNFQQRLRETVQTYLGRQGDPLDRGLTLRDLLDAGIVTIKDGFSLRSGSSSLPLAPASPVASVAPAYELDLTPPPQPTGFTAAAAISHVLVEHAPPGYLHGHGHLRTRLYGATWTSGELPTFADAVEIGQFSGEVYAHPSNPSTTWHLWIKWETVDGVLSATPAGGTNGVVATTGQDVSKLVSAMTGPGNPFKVVTVSVTLPDGSVVPPGTYTSDAFIHNGQIVNAMIANLAVDNAKIANLAVDKLTAGALAVGQYIQSTGYVAGSAGWRINADGTAEFSNAIVRGTGQFAGTILGGIASGYSAGLGFYSGGDTSGNYRWRVGNPAGSRIQWTGTAIEVYDAFNQLTFTSGGITASMVSGLSGFATLGQISSANISTYIASAAIQSAQIADAAITTAKIANANITTAKIADANITTAKIADAQITSAKIADAQITNAKITNAAVDTLKLADQAVTIPVSVYTAGSISMSYGNAMTAQSATIVSSGAPIFIICTLMWGGTGSITSFTATLKRGSTTIYTAPSGLSNGILPITLMDTPGAGTHTYTVSVNATVQGGGYTYFVSNRSLMLLETKR